ncbi:MAG: hypothetical protein HDR43_02810 [Mycoplasma sp.]|nr:hypothetical protein [Mycoplasma sp.]
MNLKLKTIKKGIKKNKCYSSYKKALQCRKCFFILTKISIIFDSSISGEELLQLETKLYKNINNPEIWKEVFKASSIFFKKPFENCDWNSFGIFMYYNWGKWIFNKNEKKNKSFYTYDNFNKLNDIKSKYYNDWMNSIISTKDLEFNTYIRKVLKSI